MAHGQTTRIEVPAHALAGEGAGNNAEQKRVAGSAVGSSVHAGQTLAIAKLTKKSTAVVVKPRTDAAAQH